MEPSWITGYGAATFFLIAMSALTFFFTKMIFEQGPQARRFGVIVGVSSSIAIFFIFYFTFTELAVRWG